MRSALLTGAGLAFPAGALDGAAKEMAKGSSAAGFGADAGLLVFVGAAAGGASNVIANKFAAGAGAEKPNGSAFGAAAAGAVLAPDGAPNGSAASKPEERAGAGAGAEPPHAKSGAADFDVVGALLPEKATPQSSNLAEDVAVAVFGVAPPLGPAPNGSAPKGSVNPLELEAAGAVFGTEGAVPYILSNASITAGAALDPVPARARTPEVEGGGAK
jgi:hypothetical protein